MIYLFDKQQNIIGLLKEIDLTAGQINFKINTAIEFSFSVPINKGFSDDVKYVSTPHPKDNSKHLIFRLMSRTDNVDSIEYTASELAYQELSSSAYIEDKRPNGVTASQAMTTALEGSQWSLGTVNISGNVTTNFYYITNLEAVQKVVGLMGGEVYFYITITGNKISGRFMDYVFRQGNDTSKVFAYGSNLLTVTKKQQSDSIYTAILPRGKGEQVSSGTDGSPDGYGRRIDISGVTWSKSSGNPLDKPAGSKILEDPEATAKYGHINGSARLYLKTFDEVEDPNVLIQQAYQTLMSINHPLVEYSATVAKVGNLSLGDTVLIMHSDRDLSYKTRVFEVKYDLLNHEMTELSLGDNLSSNSITSQINQLSGSIATNSNQVQWSVANGGHNNTSFGALEPTNPKKGDVWFKALPNGNTEEYYFDGTIWVLGAKTDQQWQENRAVAQGDNTVYYGNVEPVGAAVGDVWFKNDNNEPDGKAMYTYSGSVWVKFTGAADASRLQVGTIDASKINVMNISADNIVTGELSANFIKGGQLDFAQINGININASNITSGTIDANVINVVNINVDHLIGNTSEWVLSSWRDATGNSVTIDANGLYFSPGTSRMTTNGFEAWRIDSGQYKAMGMIGSYNWQTNENINGFGLIAKFSGVPHSDPNDPYRNEVWGGDTIAIGALEPEIGNGYDYITPYMIFPVNDYVGNMYFSGNGNDTIIMSRWLSIYTGLNMRGHAISNSSGYSLKENFSPVSGAEAIDIFDNTEIMTYDYKPDTDNMDEQTRSTMRNKVGFVINDNGKSPFKTDERLIRYGNTRDDSVTVGYLMAAVKELNKKIKDLNERIKQ